MHNIKFPKFSWLFQNYLKQMKFLTQLKLDNSISVVITPMEKMTWGLDYFDQFRPTSQNKDQMYCSASQEWPWRNILFTKLSGT